MVIVASLAAALVLGLDPRRAALLAAAWFVPLAGSAVVLLLLIRPMVTKTDGHSDEMVLLDLAASLRAGQSLRGVLSNGPNLEQVRLVRAGRSIDDVVAVRWPRNTPVGEVLVPALSIVDEMGGPTAPVLESVAEMTMADRRVRREVAMATAGPIAQGLVIGGVPLVVLMARAVSGGLGRSVARGGVHALTTIIGSILIILGILSVLAILRRVKP